MGFSWFVQHYTRLYSLRLDCSMVSFTAAKTNLMFSVSENNSTKHFFTHLIVLIPPFYNSDFQI